MSVARGQLLESLAGRSHLSQDKKKHNLSFHPPPSFAPETPISEQCLDCRFVL